MREEFIPLTQLQWRPPSARLSVRALPKTMAKTMVSELLHMGPFGVRSRFNKHCTVRAHRPSVHQNAAIDGGDAEARRSEPFSSGVADGATRAE